MTLAQKQQQISADLAALPNVQQRLNSLVDQARRRPPLPPEDCTEAHRVPGCLARLWLVAESREGRCWFRADSDSLIIKATAGLLCELYSGETPAGILAHDPGFLAQYGIQQHLTPNRRNALARVWAEIRGFAKAQSAGAASGPAPGGP
jgi:cysteine desulfuration protein SufE